LFGDELFRRSHRTSAEVVMSSVGDADEALGRPDQAIWATKSFSPCNTSTGAVILLARGTYLFYLYECVAFYNEYKIGI
jgi:hypothetical protein